MGTPQTKYLIRTFEEDFLIAADTCELKDHMLIFRSAGDVVGIMAEWVFVAKCKDDTANHLTVVK